MLCDLTSSSLLYPIASIQEQHSGKFTLNSHTRYGHLNLAKGDALQHGVLWARYLNLCLCIRACMVSD